MFIYQGMATLDKEPTTSHTQSFNNRSTFVLELLRIACVQASNIKTKNACTSLETHDLSKLVTMITFGLPLATSHEHVSSLPSWNGQYTMKFFFN